MVFQGDEYDTIAAIATPYGESGIGIVRISGPEAKRIAGKIFRPRRGPKTLKSHHIRYGEIVDPEIHMGGVCGSPHPNGYFDVAAGKGDRNGSTPVPPNSWRFDSGPPESVDAFLHSRFDPKIPV